MTLLATKISELVDAAIANNEVSVWRGILSTQEWKILAQSDGREVHVKAVRRDDGEGEPE
jgi:ssDNA-binding replication factor A large subunit